MRKATLADKHFIQNLLTQSFNDNRSVNYVVKQDKNRVERIKKLIHYSFNMCLAYGEVWVSDNQQACALILFPDKKRLSLRSLFWDMRLAIGAISIDRISIVLKREALIKSSYPKERIAYLWFVAVDPTVQGKGIGSSFIQELIGEYQLKERPIYLETSMGRNLPFYTRLGFEIIRTFDFGYTLYQLRKA
ncbi:N-acetyltransferase [Chryseotalea sanaruensis]|uniref:N-acetyltransferase n=1 Tax=Chryseotalea sanaruensis TaxID=2482724 RepID=A0A401U5X8_9BACT|nr:GNAT family N-acetyltransferase [Chryseotalea sanaruensis]GCC50323.1 N-acetyltransferase [Chryseotalea sanaruensis]